MKLLSKILVQVAFSLGLVAAFGASNANATVVNFTQSEAPGVTCCGAVNANAWSSFGITVANAYWYTDNRDTFDSQGLSIYTSPASLNFAAPVSNLSLQYWVISGHTGTYTAFNALNAVVDTLIVNAQNVDLLGTYLFAFGGPVARIEWSGDNGFPQVSGISYDAVPEPSAIAVLGMALLSLFGFRLMRRRAEA